MPTVEIPQYLITEAVMSKRQSSSRGYFELLSAKADEYIAQKAKVRASPVIVNLQTGLFIKKDMGMRQVEAAFCLPGEDLHDLLGRYYTRQKISFDRMGEIVGKSRSTLNKWFGLLGIPKLERTARVREFWSNEENKSRTVGKIHTESSDLLRAKAMQDWHNSHPDKKYNFTAVARAGRTTRKKIRDSQLLNLQSDLEQFKKKRLTYRELEESWGVSTGVVRAIVKAEYPERADLKKGLDHRRRERAEEVGHLRGKLGIFRDLTPREQMVLDTLYPVDQPPRTFGEAKDILGVARSRVGQLEQAILIKLRRRLFVQGIH